MAEENDDRGPRPRFAAPTPSLTTRILAVNLIPLLILAGSLFFLDSYRRQLLDERYKLARIEAQITAEALAGASRERQEALLIQIGKEQHMRLRMYDAEGELWADSFDLAEPSFEFRDPAAQPWSEDVARAMDRAVDFLVNAEAPPDYVEPAEESADAWPEVVVAREQRRTQVELRRAPDRTPVITAAAPVGLNGATLLTTRNAADITQAVRDARTLLLEIIALALVVSIVLSLYLARTIINPLRRLGAATVRVRLGRDREVEVPRMQQRGDEIGVLARAVSDMTAALRQRIDAMEAFGADLAHEIKNPFASLRSAVESLARVEDKDLRDELNKVALHDVRRVDRLVTEIAEASRIDAELSRATFEPIDLSRLIENVIKAREDRNRNAGRAVVLDRERKAARVVGVPIRLERVIENLLDNAVSFSPEKGAIAITVRRDGDRVRVTICDEGPGIPESEREKVFARFHTARPESEGFGDHSGLGLAIARTIAEAHDGSLTAEDRPDGKPGACLVLELPAA
jgi:two-component system, OmpR family, sensor histidine kinase ChvG